MAFVPGDALPAMGGVESVSLCTADPQRDLSWPPGTWALPRTFDMEATPETRCRQVDTCQVLTSRPGPGGRAAPSLWRPECSPGDGVASVICAASGQGQGQGQEVLGDTDDGETEAGNQLTEPHSDTLPT